MKFTRECLRLYAVTNLHGKSEDFWQIQIDQVLQNGVTCLQYRDKTVNDRTFVTQGQILRKICDRYHVPLIINDRAHLVDVIGADGVHVGQSDLLLGQVRQLLSEEKIIGVSAHSVEEALSAQKEGANYLGLGAVFHTDSKLDANIMSLSVLRAICEAVQIPTVAIGGINAHNIGMLADSGVDGVAVISALFGTENCVAATQVLSQRVKQLFD